MSKTPQEIDLDNVRERLLEEVSKYTPGTIWPFKYTFGAIECSDESWYTISQEFYHKGWIVQPGELEWHIYPGHLHPTLFRGSRPENI